MVKDYYNILEVNKNATDEEIKKSYRKLSKKYHPDLNPNNVEAENKFKEIAEAYSILSDKDKKSNYDNYGDPSGRQNQFDGMNMEDVFSNFFSGGNPFGGGGRRNTVIKGSDIRININISLEEVFSGVHKKIKYKRKCKCNTCSGTGGDHTTCTTCNGHGLVNQVQNTHFGRMQTTITCPTCNGEGKKIINPCTICNGSGSSDIEDYYEFNIPKGIMGGEALRVSNKGNYIKNGKEGDLLINIVEKPHEKFRRVGLDLHQRVNFTYKELVIGSSVEIPTINGRIKMNINPGTSVGSLLRVPKKGLIRGVEQGDMIVETWLDIPKNLTEEEKNEISSLKI